MALPALAGCGGEGSGEAEHETAEIERPSARAVPERLAATESGAEDVVALALSRDRRGVVARTAELAKAASPLGGPAAACAELKRRTARLARVARDGSFVDVALAANAVSELMPSLYRRFETRLAAEILALDYLDREAQLHSLARQPQAVTAAVGKLSRTWAGVRPGIVAAGGADDARHYAAHVRALRRLSPAAARLMQAEARRGLELVDRLERVVVTR